MKKKTPEFKSETEERLFWQKRDSSEYIDWSDAENPKPKAGVFSNIHFVLNVTFSKS